MSAALRVHARDLRLQRPSGFRLALDELRLHAGERVACIGPSGCGKTTLVHLLTGILEPDAGEVQLDGRPLSRQPDAARRARRLAEVGFVFQEFELIESLTARENIGLPWRLGAPRPADADARIERLAAACGLTARLDAHPARLSQGERQRVALCRALVTEPALIVADEPTGNLDPGAARSALELLIEHAAAADAALLVVTHDHALLPHFDRVLVLPDGTFRDEGRAPTPVTSAGEMPDSPSVPRAAATRPRVTDLLGLAARHLRHHPLRSTVLVLCLAVAALLAPLGQLVVSRYEAQLVARAEATPLLAGPRGDRFDLVLGSLWFRRAALGETLPWGLTQRLVQRDEALLVPLHLRHTARGATVVATTPEYAERRGLRCAAGELPLLVGEVALGAALAERLELGVGDVLHSDPVELYDLRQPPTLRLAIVGVLAPRGDADDQIVLTGLATGWALDGLLHGHDTPDADDDALLIGQSDEHVAYSPALLQRQELDAADLADVHGHGDPAQRPVSAALLWPRSSKARTLLTSRINAAGDARVVSPRAVIDELLAHVLRLQGLVTGIAALLGLVAGLLTGLVLLLDARLRARESLTLDRLGAARGSVACLRALDAGLVLLAAAGLAAAGLLVAAWWLPDLARLLG